MVNNSIVSLYFHIPFCHQKCPYCHFYTIPAQERFKDLLLESLLLEWEQKKPLLQGKKVTSVYFGGGTPTLFSSQRIKRLLETLFADGVEWDESVEITIESNPEEATAPLFHELLSIGVNRLSLGVQSFDDDMLRVLGRKYSARCAMDAVHAARNAGFTNISVDLLYDLPQQDEKILQATLCTLKHLPVQHVSLYNLTIEPHTAFYKYKDTLCLPNAELSAHLLQRAVTFLTQQGWLRYEISAFAQSGYASRHNTGYWTGRCFLGFGPSAFSYWDGARFRNVANLQRYARLLHEGKDAVDFSEKLPSTQSRKELLAIRLRLLDGVAHSQLHLCAQDTLDVIDKWIAAGLLERCDERVRLSEKGTFFYDLIAADII